MNKPSLKIQLKNVSIPLQLDIIKAFAEMSKKYKITKTEIMRLGLEFCLYCRDDKTKKNVFNKFLEEEMKSELIK